MAEPVAAKPASRRLKQFVLKPTVFCYHRCPYCDLRQDYYREMVADRKRSLHIVSTNGQSAEQQPARKPNPGHMPLDMALRTIEEAAELGMEELQLSGGDPLLYPHLIEVIQAAKRHPGVFVLMNSVGTGVTVAKAREIIEAGLGAWNFSIDTLDPLKYELLRGVRDALPTILDAVHTVREAGRGRDVAEFRMNYMTVITRLNFRDIPEIVAHCVDTGIASIYLMNVYGDTTGKSLLTEPEIREFRGETVPSILDILRSKNTADIVQANAAQVLASFFSADNSDANYAQGVYWPDRESARIACHVPDYYALIEPDGRTLPCCLVEISHEGEIGNVMDRSLTEVFTGEDADKFRRERIPFCQKCPSPRNRTLGLVPYMCRQFRD
ncbi:radical SAM protein [Nonomuraea sp. NN258]|uniref:radical SAM protein n=1 Tax=Nonomuraea antri TaxID=2730852 RepID=UPI001569E2E4|nr:radical SAM protein [Nonomuraea antri]NRQ37980.1 radical SAM protein [Nonomuraea antri]